MKKKFKLKNKKPLIFILLLVFGVSVASTFAYYYSQVLVPNQFKTKTYNVSIKEEFNNTWGTKRVTFVNNEATNVAVVLRVNFNESWSKVVDGILLTLDNNVNGTNVVDKNWTQAFLNDFTKGADGWYYYKKILKPTEEVTILESISRNDTLINSSPYADDYKNYDYELSFNLEAIQATTDAVLDLWGKTITIAGDAVTW